VKIEENVPVYFVKLNLLIEEKRQKESIIPSIDLSKS
jgi:hypothetical protein